MDIPPCPLSHSATPLSSSFTSVIVKQEIIPKLRNIKIELTYVEEVRDMIDLKYEHIVALSRIIVKLEQL